MSHFNVIVFGGDYERQLAPYHEFECTGIADEYVQSIDKLAEARKDFEEHSGRYKTLAKFCEEYWGMKPATGAPDLEGEHKYGWMRVTPDGDVTELIDRTNPNKKWDWYSVGGRWTGYFAVKKKPKYPEDVAVGERPFSSDPDKEKNKPGYADQLRKCDIDIEAMQKEKRRKCNEEYDKVEAATKGCLPALTFEEMRQKLKGDDERVRKNYHAQAYVQALKAAEIDRWFDDVVELYRGGREAFVERQVRKCMVPFAAVHEGQWHEKGRMGWWGAVANEKADDEWSMQFWNLFSSLPEDTLVTVVDCHI